MPYLEELLAQCDAITAALTEWKGVQRGFVRIGANPAMSSFLLPSLLKSFRKKWPGVALMLDVDVSPNLSHRVASRSLDLAMGLWDDPSQGRVASRARWEYEVVAVTSGQDSANYTRLQDLSGQPFVRLPQGAVLAAWIDSYLNRYEVRPSQVMVVNNAQTMMSLICAGLGIGMLPMWAVAAEVRNGTLSVIRCEEPPLMGTLDLITAKSGYLPPPVKAFIDLAREESSWEHVRLQTPQNLKK
jgi:DNA-binding transcriptional LysR family regulator